jgi:hypothetical protein
MECPIQQEIDIAIKEFNLQEIADFQKYNSIQVICGADFMYCCYINNKCYSVALTPLFAMWHGIKLFKESLS